LDERVGGIACLIFVSLVNKRHKGKQPGYAGVRYRSRAAHRFPAVAPFLSVAWLYNGELEVEKSGQPYLRTSYPACLGCSQLFQLLLPSNRKAYKSFYLSCQAE